jgi:hypothetical protein
LLVIMNCTLYLKPNSLMAYLVNPGFRSLKLFLFLAAKSVETVSCWMLAWPDRSGLAGVLRFVDSGDKFWRFRTGLCADDGGSRKFLLFVLNDESALCDPDRSVSGMSSGSSSFTCCSGTSSLISLAVFGRSLENEEVFPERRVAGSMADTEPWPMLSDLKAIFYNQIIQRQLCVHNVIIFNK